VCSQRKCVFEVILARLLIILCEICKVICMKCVVVVTWIESELDFMSANSYDREKGAVLVCRLLELYMFCFLIALV
jgi:hypothetical protein